MALLFLFVVVCVCVYVCVCVCRKKYQRVDEVLVTAITTDESGGGVGGGAGEGRGGAGGAVSVVGVGPDVNGAASSHAAQALGPFSYCIDRLNVQMELAYMSRLKWLISALRTFCWFPIHVYLQSSSIISNRSLLAGISLSFFIFKYIFRGNLPAGIVEGSVLSVLQSTFLMVSA